MFRIGAALLVGAIAGGRLAATHASLVSPFPAAILDERRSQPGADAPDSQESVRNVRDLVVAVRGLPPVVCGLTAEAASGWGGRSWMNAPVTPLGVETAERVAHFPRARLLLSEVSLLVDSLSTSDPCVREVAVRLLGRMDAPLVEGRMIDRLSASTARTVREAATLVLGLVSSKAAYDPLLRLIGDDDVGVRANAVWALGRLGNEQAAPAVRRTLGDGDEIVRGAAAGALGALEDQASVEDLVRVMRNDRSRRVRRVAAWALGNIEARQAEEPLAQALRAEQEKDVREMIAWALGNIEGSSAAPALIDALRRDASEDVRETAAWALGNMEATSAASALGEAAGSDASADVRGTAAWALGQLELREAPAGLLRAVSDADAEVRTKAAWALSEIGDSRAADVLRTAMRKESSAQARKAQLRALVQGGERSESFFKELLTSDDPEVREAAVKGMAGRGMHPWPWPNPRPRPFP